jgi:hypothetical protein
MQAAEHPASDDPAGRGARCLELPAPEAADG